MGGELIILDMIYISTGCLAAATAAAAAAAFIAPALGYIPTSNTRAHRPEHKRNPGHSTHNTITLLTPRAYIASSHTLRYANNDHTTRPARSTAASELTVRGARGGRFVVVVAPLAPAAPPDTRGRRCRTYFLESNFSSTIFMFEEYSVES